MDLRVQGSTHGGRAWGSGRSYSPGQNLEGPASAAAKEDNILVRGTAVCYPPIPKRVFCNVPGSDTNRRTTQYCPLWERHTAVPQGFVPGNSSSQSPRRVPHVLHMGDAPGALGGAIPRDKALRDCCVSFPKRTILSSASVGIRAGDVTIGPSKIYSYISYIPSSFTSRQSCMRGKKWLSAMQHKKFGVEREALWRRVVLVKYGSMEAGWTTKASHWAVWSGGEPLKEAFLELYRIARIKEATVADSIRFWVNINRYEEDKMCWKLSPDKGFQVKSYYKELSSMGVGCFPWKSIWKTKVPPRVAFFSWTAALGKILIAG
uniref:Reverse transcriptase zinc-binding domain-containing protein n=1 Tax=Fagus sylvatica TaxID=28930 RepID=A0A2N9ECM4_FAGSY